MARRECMPYQDLQGILNLTIGWEKELKDFYDVAEVALRDERSRKAVTLLRDRLLHNLKVLEAVDVEKYGKTEWVLYSMDFRTEELIPKTMLKRDSTPREIFERILECEEKLKGFCAMIRDLLVSREQGELFDSLVAFRVAQIIEIKSFMESFDQI
jgi:hypothetical protein